MSYLIDNGGILVNKTFEHLYISVVALLLAMIVAIPLGFYYQKRKVIEDFFNCSWNLTNNSNFSNFSFNDSTFGVGKTTAIIALFIYVLLPILNNTIVGVQNIDSNVKEAGRSMGMTNFQLMKDIELPLALPMVLSGIRLSSVYVISWAALASYVGAGGLGDLIFNGLALYEPEMIIVGTILVTLLALIVDLILAQIEKWIIPKGLKISR